MSKYRITLEGKTYEMEVELIPEETSARPAAGTGSGGAGSNGGNMGFKGYQGNKGHPGAPTDPTIRVMDPSAQRTTTSTAGTVTAPMPGTVVRLEKAEGDPVTNGELVLVLEAMKMENEIVSPSDGKIKSINCAPGDTVAGGDVLFTVE